MAHATRWPSGRTHPGQTAETGASQQVDEHRLDAIVGGMAGEDVIGKNGVSRVAGPRFDVGPGFDRHGSRFERRTELARACLNEIGLSRRVGSESMVDVDRGDAESVRDGESEESE